MKENNMFEIYMEGFRTFKKKNKDYGNSFSKLFNEYGMLSVLIRLDDKLNRLKSLQENEREVKDESVQDTLEDMMNYCAMALYELERVEFNKPTNKLLTNKLVRNAKGYERGNYGLSRTIGTDKKS